MIIYDRALDQQTRQRLQDICEGRIPEQLIVDAINKAGSATR